MSEKVSSPMAPMDAAEIEARLPPLSRSYGTIATIERGVEAKLGPLAHRDFSDERPTKARRVERSDYQGWTREPLTALDSDKESLLFILPSASMNLSLNGETVDDAEGCVLVTTHRLLFIAKDESQDLAIDAICVTLHAMTSDPEISVYCQLSSDSLKDLSLKSTTAIAEEDDENTQDMMDGEVDGPVHSPLNGPIEIFFTPKIKSRIESDITDTEQKMKLCEDFFRVLGTLAALNPIYDDEGEDMYDADYFDPSEEAVYDTAEEEEDFIYRLDNKYPDDEEGATNEERKAMLARLDTVLTVPAEYEQSDLIQEGQFDDADDNSNLL